MSASGTIARVPGLSEETSERCKIIIVYDDKAARASGMLVCERLSEQFGKDLDFEFNWWSFKRLTEPAQADRTKEMAAAADIVMFCTQATELPEDVADWLESWTESGAQADGAIALVMTESQGHKQEAVQRLTSKFGETARRLGMDFLQLAAPVFIPATVTANAVDGTIPAAMAANVERSHNYHWGLND